MNPRFLAPLFLIGALAASGLAQPDPNYVVNGDFAAGLKGWSVEGNVQSTGDASTIGPGKGALAQRYDIPGLRIVEFGATLKLSSIDVKAAIRVQCLDRHGHLVMDLKQPVNAKKGADSKGDAPGIYFKTQANTAFLLVRIEKDSDDAGTVTVSSVHLHDYDHDRVEHPPTCDLESYMKPIWQGNTVYNETALMLSTDGHLARARLLYSPTKILSVTDSTLQASYEAGRDFAVEGREIVATPSTRMTTMHDYDFPKGDYPWLSVAGKHVVVTYEHDDEWNGPRPSFQGEHLAKSVEKLRTKHPFTVVALGDSITLGINVSGYRGEAPFMPTWVDLFRDQLAKQYQDPHVHVYNVALGGMTAKWGADNARDAVAALNPDLVLIAFGMNDFWSVSPAEFRASVESTMQTIRAHRPSVEFILISSIRFDPAYTHETVYVGHLSDYAKELRGLVGPGVGLLDMTAISEAIYSAKSAKDVMADPMHPDDFLARWYAQGLVAMLSL